MRIQDHGYYPSGRLEECDNCHGDRVETFMNEDDDGGEWAYCLPCIKKAIARKIARKVKAS